MRFYHSGQSWRKRPTHVADAAVEIDDGLVSDADARKFLQTVVAGPGPLVKLRNQISFLVDDLWERDPIGESETKAEEGYSFYVWVLLPCPASMVPPGDQPIVAHDVIYVRRALSPREIRKVQSHMRQLDFRVWPRRLVDPAPAALPFRWARPSEAGTENVA